MQTVSDSYKTAIKAGQRHAKAQVVVYFASGQQTFTSDDALANNFISDIHILEETGQDTTNPLGSITSNECTITFDNMDGRFTSTNAASPYYGQLVPNVKVEVSWLVLLPGDTYETIKAGTFYTGDWVASNSGGACTVTCRDRLQGLMDRTVAPVKVQRNVLMSTIFTSIFTSLGLTASDFIIDSRITQSVGFGYVVEGAFKNIAGELSEACFATIYTNRNDQIVVQSLLTADTTPVDIWTDDDLIFDMDNPVTYLDTYSTVRVTYKKPAIRTTQELLNLTEVVLDAGQTVQLNKLTTQGIVAGVDRIFILGGYVSSVLEIKLTPNAVDLKLTNPGTQQEVVNVNLVGRTIELTDAVITIEDAAAVAAYGSRVLELDNSFIQTETLATALANNVLKIAGNPKARYKVSGRGNPAVELFDVISVGSVALKYPAASVVVTRIETFFDGALSSEVTATIPIQ